MRAEGGSQREESRKKRAIGCEKCGKVSANCHLLTAFFRLSRQCANYVDKQKICATLNTAPRVLAENQVNRKQSRTESRSNYHVSRN